MKCYLEFHPKPRRLLNRLLGESESRAWKYARFLTSSLGSIWLSMHGANRLRLRLRFRLDSRYERFMQAGLGLGQVTSFIFEARETFWFFVFGTFGTSFWYFFFGYHSAGGRSQIQGLGLEVPLGASVSPNADMGRSSVMPGVSMGTWVPPRA